MKVQTVDMKVNHNCFSIRTQFLNPFCVASKGSSAANIAEENMMHTRIMLPKVDDADKLQQNTRNLIGNELIIVITRTEFYKNR